MDAQYIATAQPVTCVTCGGVSLRGFVYCGWCGRVLRDETQLSIPPAMPVTSGTIVTHPPLRYQVEPVDFALSQAITLQRWPAESAPTREITQPSISTALDLTDDSVLQQETDPRVAIAVASAPGLRVLVLGPGASGMHRDPTEVHALGVGDDLDVILGDSHKTTSFHVEQDGLRVEEVGTPRGVARLIRGQVRLRNGDAFRIGQTWLVYAREEGRERWGVYGRVYVLAPSGHVITSYEVRESGLVLGTELGDPTLVYDPYVTRRHCRIVAGPTGATLEDLGGPDGTFVAVAEGELIPTGSIALFADTAVRIELAA